MKKKIRTPKNSLNVVAEKIHQAERGEIFNIGAWLLEARELCKQEQRKWGAWLYDEFGDEISEDTAARQMKVAELGNRFRKLRNLKLAKTTLYEIVEEEKSDQQAIVAELTKRASKRRLKPAEASTIITIGRARGRYGNFSDATLKAVDSLQGEWLQEDLSAWQAQAIAELKSKDPQTDGEAEEIIGAFRDRGDALEEDGPDDSAGDPDSGGPAPDRGDALKEDGPDDSAGDPDSGGPAADHEAEQLLSNPPSPPPPPDSELDLARARQRKQFREVVEKIAVLNTKPMSVYDSAVPENELRRVVDFFNALAKHEPLKSTELRKLEMENLDLKTRVAELEAAPASPRSNGNDVDTAASARARFQFSLRLLRDLAARRPPRDFKGLDAEQQEFLANLVNDSPSCSRMLSDFDKVLTHVAQLEAENRELKARIDRPFGELQLAGPEPAAAELKK